VSINISMCNTPEAIAICEHCPLQECVDINHPACPLRQHFEAQGMIVSPTVRMPTMEGIVTRATARILRGL
jgi:hypothetical protein